MIAELGEVSLKTAAELFLKSENHAKTAIVMAKLKKSAEEAGKCLEAVDGNLSKIL